MDTMVAVNNGGAVQHNSLDLQLMGRACSQHGLTIDACSQQRSKVIKLEIKNFKSLNTNLVQWMIEVENIVNTKVVEIMKIYNFFIL
jgi:hypothetical protein